MNNQNQLANRGKSNNNGLARQEDTIKQGIAQGVVEFLREKLGDGDIEVVKNEDGNGAVVRNAKYCKRTGCGVAVKDKSCDCRHTSKKTPLDLT
jgi:hypothetical protein